MNDLADHIKLIHQRDQSLYPDVLFNRPISGLGRMHVALFGGGKRGVVTLSEVYSSMLSTGIEPTCVVEAPTANLAPLPIGSIILHTDKKTQQVSETAEVLSFVARSNMVILAPEAELGSALQILFEKVLSETQTPVVITDEVVGLYRFTPRTSKRANVLFILSSEGLMKLANALALPVKIRPGRGIYNTLALVEAVYEATGAHVLSFDNEQAVVRDGSSSDEYGIIHVQEGSISQHRGLLIGLIAGLLSDVTQTFTSVLPKLMTAGYLFNAIMSQSNGLHDPAMLDRAIKDTLSSEL